MAALWIIAALSCRGAWSFLLLLSLAYLNPQFLDFCCAARGYGLSTAFLLWAIVCVMQGFLDDGLESRQWGWWTGASVLMGLSLAANLSSLFSNVAVSGILCVVAIIKKRERFWQTATSLFTRVLVPGPIVALAFWWPLLIHFTKETFYVGWTTYSDSAAEYLSAALFHDRSGICTLADNALTPYQLLGAMSLRAQCISLIATFLVPLGIAVLLVVVVWMAVRVVRSTTSAETASVATILCGGALVFSFIAFIITHAFRGMLFPPDRAIVYVGPLAAVCCVLSVQEVIGLGTRLSVPFALVGSSIVLVFILNFNTNHFRTWRYDAGVQRFVRVLASQGKSSDRWRVGGTWLHEPAIRIYSNLLIKHGEQPWLEAAERFADVNTCDAIIIDPTQQPALDAETWSLIDTDPVSGAQLFVKMARKSQMK